MLPGRVCVRCAAVGGTDGSRVNRRIPFRGSRSRRARFQPLRFRRLPRGFPALDSGGGRASCQARASVQKGGNRPLGPGHTEPVCEYRDDPATRNPVRCPRYCAIAPGPYGTGPSRSPESGPGSPLRRGDTPPGESGVRRSRAQAAETPRPPRPSGRDEGILQRPRDARSPSSTVPSALVRAAADRLHGDFSEVLQGPCKGLVGIVLLKDAGAEGIEAWVREGRCRATKQDRARPCVPRPGTGRPSRCATPCARDERGLFSAVDAAFRPSPVVADRRRKPILMGHHVRPGWRGVR